MARLDPRQTLPDRLDESVLCHAESQVACYLAAQFGGLPHPVVDELVQRLTSPEIRHHVSTLLDLTPSKSR